MESRSSNATISSSGVPLFKYFKDAFKLFLQPVIAISCRLVVSTTFEPDVFFEINYIDALMGKTTVDDILNKVFSGFCVGK